MESGIGLTSEEKNKLARVGFLVKNYSTYWGLIKTLLFWQFVSMWIMIIPIIIVASGGVNVTGLGFFALHIVFFYKIISLPMSYIFVGKIFIFYNKGKLKIIHPFSSSLFRSVKSMERDGFISQILNKWGLSIGPTIFGIGFIIFFIVLSISFIGILTSKNPAQYSSVDFFMSYFIFSSITYSLVSLVYLLGKSIVNSTNGFYAFGNLGEKIQSLTPKISEQSNQIESEFRGDMDFRVLSKSFDTLASTFSQIVNLVVRLEQVEKKANKGDLFDSTKYIGSLREDIRTPLLSLKTFLESKKTELQSSQKELMRVRVSVGGEKENREVQSIRVTELMKELDENIGKVDVMLEKI